MEIKYIDLQKVIIFLQDLNFKGISSIHRTQVTNKMGKKLEEVSKGEKTIRKDFKDDIDKLDSELEAYFKETYSLKGDELFKPLNTIKEKIKSLVAEDSEEEFSGESAYVLNILYEQFNLEEGE